LAGSFVFTPPLLIALGSIILVWVACLTWYDITIWGKDTALIFFGSRTGEVISLGIGMQVIHYLLIGVALQLLGLGLTRVTGKPVVIERTKSAKNGKTPPVSFHPPKSAKTCILPITPESDEAGARALSRILPTNMVKRKTIVLKPRFDENVINFLAEKLIEKLFNRMGIFRPKPSELKLTSVEKYYERYLVVRGKYFVDHCKSLVYNLRVDKKSQEVFILNERFKPEPSGDLNHSDYNVIRLTVVSSYHHEDEVVRVLDPEGQEFDPEKLQIILNHEWPRENLSNAVLKRKFAKVNISTEEEVNLLRCKLVRRPLDVGEVIKEIFEINERTVINNPMYKLTFERIKTGKKAIATINGITGEIISSTFNKTISGKFMEDLVKDSHITIQPMEKEPVEPMSNVSSDYASRDITDSAEFIRIPLPVVKPSEFRVDEDPLEFPAKVDGEILHVGDKVTAIVGDLEIPSETIVYETLVVKGNLIIGEKCKILGTVKALGRIVIGSNTIIEGNVICNRNVSVGSNVKINGKVVIEKTFHSESTVAKGTINE